MGNASNVKHIEILRGGVPTYAYSSMLNSTTNQNWLTLVIDISITLLTLS